MTRRERDSNRRGVRALLLGLLLVLEAAAQEASPAPDPAAAPAPELKVPTCPAPTVDGKIGEEEWKGAAAFTVQRGADVYGQGRILRSGRQLYVAFDTTLSPWGLGLRLTFADPVSGRENLVLVTPVNPPRPPFAAFRHLVGRDAERVSSGACDLRFVLAGREGFSFEARLPLDLLEIVPTDKAYAFSAEMWSLDTDHALAVYPQDERSATTLVRPAVLRSEGAWGAAQVGEAAPPGNGALALLEEVDRQTETGPFLPRDAGWTDGRRKDAPLAALEERIARCAEACPDLVSIRTLLVQIRIGRNDLEGALKALDELGAFLPPLAQTSRHVLIRMQILRDLGRYDEALETLGKGAEALKDDPAVARERIVTEDLRETWRAEQETRKAEAARDDLPRVRLKTTKGTIDLELFEDDAPNGVANFVALVESHFYDGTRFHWVDGGGRVVGGDPNTKDSDPNNDGFGDPGYLIESEPGRRLTFPMTVGYADKRRERRSEGSAFVIHISPFALADGVNTVLGRVIAGEDVVRRLEYYDTIEKAEILRKRPHPYVPVKR